MILLSVIVVPAGRGQTTDSTEVLFPSGRLFLVHPHIVEVTTKPLKSDISVMKLFCRDKDLWFSSRFFQYTKFSHLTLNTHFLPIVRNLTSRQFQDCEIIPTCHLDAICLQRIWRKFGMHESCSSKVQQSFLRTSSATTI